MNKKIILLSISVLIVLGSATYIAWPDATPAEPTEPSEPTETLETFESPLYFTIVIHTEEDTSSCTKPKPQIPDYDGDEAVFDHFSMVLREFGEMVASHGAKINFGTDWTFAKGVELYDPSFFTDMEAMGHEIDSHAHGSCHEYDEVRSFIVDAGGTPTQVVSGLTEEEFYSRLEYLDNFYPKFKVLWGVANAGHGAGEEISSWVWRPSRDNWLTHDPEGDYIHIGHGEGLNSVEYVKEAIESIQANTINTYSVFTHPREYLAMPNTEGISEDWWAKPNDMDYWENRIEWWDEFLTELDQLEGLEYASLTEVAKIFESNEHLLDFDFDTENHPRTDRPAVQRQNMAGYP